MRKLVEESTKRKKEKKKQKRKEKTKKPTQQTLPNNNSNSMGKPGTHGALSKSNSIVDSVDDSIASVVSGADLKLGAAGGGGIGGIGGGNNSGGIDVHNNPSSAAAAAAATANKSLNMHHNMASTGGNAASKTAKSKGEIVKQKRRLSEFRINLIKMNIFINYSVFLLLNFHQTSTFLCCCCMNLY